MRVQTVDDTAVDLDAEERRDWLRLIRSENIGPITFSQLIAHFGSAAGAIEGVPEIARRGGRSLKLIAVEDAERELVAADEIGARFIATAEPDYPGALAAIEDAPPLLCVMGNSQTLAKKTSVAIVGSRNASVAGRKFAMTLAHGVGEAGYAIVSGLARGIDTAAHEGSLDTGTIAVLAGGLDHIYPHENIPLVQRIVDRGGTVISEMPLGRQARGKDFPRRNRIISGISVAVVVVEAAQRSGSLITARRAADQGRPVYAVPGSPLDPRAAGSNMLIREGATLVTGADDILVDIAPMRVQEPMNDRGEVPDVEVAPLPSDTDDAARRIVSEALGPSPVSVDEVIRFTGLAPPLVHLVLMELSLAGRVQRHPGQRVSLIG